MTNSSRSAQVNRNPIRPLWAQILCPILMAFVGFAAGAVFVRHRGAAATAGASDPLVIPEIRISNPTVGHELEAVSRLAKIPISVDWKALAEIGVTPETVVPVDVDLHDIRVEQVLRIVLSDLGEKQRPDSHAADFRMRNGGAFVTVVDTYSQQSIGIDTRLAAFDVSDLLNLFNRQHRAYPRADRHFFGLMEFDGQVEFPYDFAMADSTAPTTADDLVHFTQGAYANQGLGEIDQLSIYNKTLILVDSPDGLSRTAVDLEQLRQALGAGSGRPPIPVNAEPPPKPAASAQRAEAALDAILPSVEIPPGTYRQAIGHLRSLSGTNIFVLWRELPQFNDDKKVELHLHNASLRQALAELVKRARDEDSIQPGLHVKDGIISIEPYYPFDPPVLRYYDVSDLMAWPIGPKAGVVRPSSAAGDFRVARADRLLDLVQSSAAKDERFDDEDNRWILLIGNALAVAQPPSVQRRVAQSLRQLRENK